MEKKNQSKKIKQDSGKQNSRKQNVLSIKEARSLKKIEKRRGMEYLSFRSAVLMNTTIRVGIPTEDSTMKQARPILSKINELGFITEDSQMGKKESTYFQRAYVSGFATLETARKLQKAFLLEDSVLVFVSPHEKNPRIPNNRGNRSPFISLTCEKGSDYHLGDSNHPLGLTAGFNHLWNNLLPEFHEEEKSKSKKEREQLKQQCERDSVRVFAVDTKFGRPMYLFNIIVRKLQADL